MLDILALCAMLLRAVVAILLTRCLLPTRPLFFLKGLDDAKVGVDEGHRTLPIERRPVGPAPDAPDYHQVH